MDDVLLEKAKEKAKHLRLHEYEEIKMENVNKSVDEYDTQNTNMNGQN